MGLSVLLEGELEMEAWLLEKKTDGGGWDEEGAVAEEWLRSSLRACERSYLSLEE